MPKTEQSRQQKVNSKAMNKNHLLQFLMMTSAITLMTSCSTMYQVLETSSTDTKLEKDSYLFENSDIKVSYNFWADAGQVSFLLTNKLDSAIYIDWDKSHLIYNGISYEYWYDSEETNSFYSSASSTTSSTFADAMVNIFGGTAYGNSTSTNSAYGRKVSMVASSKSKPKKTIQIPAKSSIIVSKFSISKSAFYNCDFNLNNTRLRTVNTKTFGKEDSPLTFRNYLTYSTKESFEKNKSIDNEFYISSISFMSESLFLGISSSRYDCGINGTKIFGSTYEKPYRKPNSFYLKLKQK